MNTSSEQFAKLRGFLRRRAPVMLCACAVALFALALILGGVYLAFQDIALRSISLRDKEFSAQTDSMSGLMEDIVRNYGMQTFYASGVTELRENESITELERVRALRELGTYVSSSDFVDSIAVYNRASNTIYSTDSDMLCSTADKFVDKSAAQLFLNLNVDTRMKPLRRTAFAGQPGKEKDYFSFVFFETNSEDEPLGNALMINVTYNWFVGNLLSFDDRKNCVLMDRNGELVYSPKPELAGAAAVFQARDDMDDIKETGYLLEKYKGVQLVCHFSQIESIGLVCLRILPMAECVPGLLQLRNGLAAFLSVAVILLATVGTITMVFIYVPFYKIRLALRHVQNSSGTSEIQISSLVQDSVKYQKSHLLIDLLEGRNVPEQRIPQFPLTLLLIECPDPSAMRSILRESCPAVLLRHERGCEAALLPGLGETEIIEICGKLSAHAACRCYCGLPRTDPKLIPSSYATLQEIQHLRFWYPGQNILSEKNFAPRSAHSSLSEKQILALISALKGGELEEGQTLWKGILESVRGDCYRDQRFAFYRVAQLLQEALTEQGQGKQQIITDDFLKGLEDVGALTARFEVFFCRICQYSVDNRRQRLSDIAAQVLHRIEVGYEAPDLSPMRIADEMGMSSAYLSRLFRESVGQSIGEYMNKIRVENAERLLLSTDMTVEAIASKVGFGNPKYFFVVFKNATGKTPLQFRQQQSAPIEKGQNSKQP
ncbi:MAG: helix-turn-helix domain-containing protein [Oscillospiraceae bacterium]